MARTHDETPCRMALGVSSAYSKGDETHGTDDAWENQVDEQMLWLVDSAVAVSQPDVGFVSKPARVEQGAHSCWHSNNLNKCQYYVSRSRAG